MVIITVGGKSQSYFVSTFTCCDFYYWKDTLSFLLHICTIQDFWNLTITNAMVFALSGLQILYALIAKVIIFSLTVVRYLINTNVDIL